MFKSEILGTVKKPYVHMCDMEPCDIGMIEDNQDYAGHIVMRTASSAHFEVMDLTAPSQNMCWTGAPTIKVRLLPKGTTIQLEVVYMSVVDKVFSKEEYVKRLKIMLNKENPCLCCLCAFHYLAYKLTKPANCKTCNEFVGLKYHEEWNGGRQCPCTRLGKEKALARALMSIEKFEQGDE